MEASDTLLVAGVSTAVLQIYVTTLADRDVV